MEEQQAQAAAPKPDAKPTEEHPSVVAERKRLLQSLEMQRERILSERTASPHRRSALTYALADIEEKLAELGWSVHM